ncbi:HypC/HybG/HupF family hydrogenase formation chaperone [Alkalilimnicola ehrlichii MLHE-1]|uniref:Hydrogenase assembly chaperone hypC/hupF n=1 Tax=Alkalilimnicola ehrlichii (strain ATCC BAA-1101 / DSM 17681 / MLHE-1) TaxID=187272 RepID=Q0A729_ALKEH|nr:HypC/HybG/HupF family hydrogenase formation chaperone [Alkalilimnicola ehrlichii]ABI57358.1 hydrogenase assembly chaperone hypC/hupF [Alkalilimnicola ehrlichii MLHE-1]
MCLAIPVEVLELKEDGAALVDAGGVRKTVDVSLVEGVTEGEFVILHVGFAISRLDRAEAERTLALFREMGLEGDE